MTRRILPLLTLMAVVALALPAWADESITVTGSDFYIPRPANSTDQEGVPRIVASFDVLGNGFGAIVGQECRFRLHSDNGPSVHLNNYAIVSTYGVDHTVTGTEAEPDRGRDFDQWTAVLGSSIQIYNVMLPDPSNEVGTSVDYRLEIVCTTTTTSSSTTTTSVPSTTTVPVGSTTTTISTSSSTATAPPATVPPSTSTPPSTIVSEPPPSTLIPPVTTGDTLPFTAGELDPAPLLMAVVALFALGGGLLRAAKAGRHEG